MTDNMDLWHKVEKTPESQTKAITGKPYKGTSPKPYYLVQKATETFGPCGIGWGFEIVNERVENGSEGDKVHIAHIRVWYVWNDKRGSVEHVGQTMLSGKNRNGPFTDEDAPKKSVTDALVKALSMIGFAGDIFMGRYDDSKYVAELKQEEAAPKPQKPQEIPPPPEYKLLMDDLRKNKTQADIRRWIGDADVKDLRRMLSPALDEKLRNEAAAYGKTLPAGDQPVNDDEARHHPLNAA